MWEKQKKKKGKAGKKGKKPPVKQQHFVKKQPVLTITPGTEEKLDGEATAEANDTSSQVEETLKDFLFVFKAETLRYIKYIQVIISF